MLDADEGEVDDETLKMLRNGRLMVTIALVASVGAFLTLFMNRVEIVAVFWVTAFVAGLGGMRDVARATGGNSLLVYLSLLAFFMPPLGILPLLYYRGVAQSALKGLNAPAPAPAPRAQRTAAKAAPSGSAGAAAQAGLRPTDWAAGAIAESRQARAAGAAPRTQRRHELSGAIAVVKQAGLGRRDGTAGEIPEGARLGMKARAPNGEILGTESEPVVRATHGVFAVVYFLDEGSHYAYANMGQLAKAGITIDELHFIGAANLACLVNGKPGLKVLPQEGFYGLVMGGQFEASLVLLDELWDDSLREYTPNGPVVAIPARDMCAFCDSKSADGIAKLRAVAERVTKRGDHLLTQELFVRRDGRWREYVPERPVDLPPLEFK